MNRLSPDMGYSNFVLNFRAEEIDEIKRDIISHREGYLLFYAIDTYDIINHYLPYTDSRFFSSGNKSQIAQRAIAYEKFFTSFLNTKMIVLDEYKMELFSAKNYIEKEIKNAGVLKNNINVLIEDIENMHKGDADDKERIRRNIELIIFLLILSENKGNIHSNFFEFLKTKLSIFKFDTANEIRNQILDEVFDATIPSSKVSVVYDSFVNGIVYELASFGSDFERYTYLDNTYRDIEVIDRISIINSKLNTQYPTEKIKFIYLSSAPFKTKRIFSIFQETPDIVDSNNPEAEKKYDFHRNIFQCFLFKLLIEEFPRNEDSTPLKILDALKEMIGQVNSTSELAGRHFIDEKSQSNTVVQVLMDILERYSSNIDNHFYFKIYNKYKTIFELTGEEKSGQVANILNKVQTYITEERIISDGSDILYNIGQYKQTFVLKQIFSGTDANVFVHLNFGKDIIRDSFQHLPYLLFIQSSVNNSIVDNLYPLFDKISNFSTNKFERVDELTPYLESVFKQISDDTGSLNNLAVRLLLTAYLYLITEGKGAQASQTSAVKFNKKEIRVIESLRKQKNILENSALALKKAQDHKRVEIERRQMALAKEFDYMLLWLLRRNQQYNEAIDLGNELVNKYEDGRFCHGLALSYTAQAYAIIKNDRELENMEETVVSLLDNSLIYLQKAKLFYTDLLETITDNHAVSLLKKTLMAVYNSIADQSLRKYELYGMKADDVSLLEMGRVTIAGIKALCTDIHIDYNRMVIYNYTEIELEYYEALDFFSKGDLHNANGKIVDATNKISQTSNKENAMDEVFKKIINNVKYLRIDIFKQLGILK